MALTQALSLNALYYIFPNSTRKVNVPLNAELGKPIQEAE